MDGTSSLSSLSKKTRVSYHSQMSEQRQHILLSYFRILSVGPCRESNLVATTPKSGTQPRELIVGSSLSFNSRPARVGQRESANRVSTIM